MSMRQRGERGNEVPNLFMGGLDADPAAELLQHINAGPPVRRIHHEMHRAIRFEHAAQGSESRIGIWKMMKNPGADDLIEGRLQFVCPLNGKLAELEIV